MGITEKRNPHWPLMMLGIYMFLHMLHCPAPVIVGGHGQHSHMPAEHGVPRHPWLGLMTRLESKVARHVQEAAHRMQGVADGTPKADHLRLQLLLLLQRDVRKKKETHTQVDIPPPSNIHPL